MAEATRLLRSVAAFLAVAAAYFLSAEAGLSQAIVNPSVSEVWPSTGFAMAALALMGYRLWPAIFLGAFLANFDQTGNWPSSLGIATGNAMEATLGAWILRSDGLRKPLEQTRAFLRFFFAAGMGATSLSATLGTLSLYLAGFAAPHNLGPIWLTWWMGDMLSAWVLTPFLIALHGFFRSKPDWPRLLRGARLAEASALGVTVLVVNLILFGGLLSPPYHHLPLAYLALPPILWAAFRFGRLGAYAALALHAGIAVWGTSRGYGQFALLGADRSGVVLHLFLVTGLVSFHTLAVLIWARDHAKARLKATLGRIESIVRSVPGIVWETIGDPDGRVFRVTFMSEHVRYMLGYAPEEFVADSGLLVRTIHPDDRSRVRKEIARGRFAGWEGGGRFRLIAKDGSVVEAEVHAVSVQDADGRFVGMRGFAMDVTERKRTEERLRAVEAQLRQSQKMEAIGRLAGGVAHDFNNLLTAMSGYSELLASSLDPASPLREYAEEIRRAGERAGALTRQLLSFSRKEAGRPRVFDLNHLVSDLEKMLRRLIGEDIRLAAVLDPAPQRVVADPDQVGQVIVNLAVNARDAMAHGGTLTLSTAGEILADGMPGFHLRPAPGAYARLTVSDTGTGMPAEVLERLFEPFYTTKRSQGEHGAAGGTGGARGTGLGLSTVYGILERNGGGIRVETEVGAGSSFHVYLPAAPPEREGGQGGLGRASIPEPDTALAFARRGET